MHNETIISKGKYAHPQQEMLISVKQYMFVRDEKGKKRLLLRFLNERNEKCTGFEFVLSLMDARGKVIREERFESSADYYAANASFGFDHPIPVDERCTDFRVRLLRVSFGDYVYRLDRVDPVVTYEKAKKLNTAMGAEKSRRKPRIHTRKIRLPWMCAIIALFVLAAVFATFAFLLYNFMDGKTVFSLSGVQYEFVGGNQDSTEVMIIGYTGFSGDVLLPSEIEGRRVIGIREGAFDSNFRVRNVRVENLDVPNHAFRNCGNLETLELYNVSSVGQEAFYNCNSLVAVKSDTMQKIGERAFYECDSLLSVELTHADATVQLSLGKEAFANCSSLDTVSIAQTIVYPQAQNLFANATSLKNLYLNNFYYTLPGAETPTTESGKLIALFGNVQSADMQKLQNVVIGYMDKMAADFCDGFPALQSVAILNSDIIDIPKNAFRNCASLSVFSTRNTVLTVGDEAFKNTALKQFNGGALISIGNNAFTNCTKLTEILIMPEGTLSSIGQAAFSGCRSLKSITIPVGIKEIPKEMLSGCASLESVVFSDSCVIESIPEKAFADCTSLQSIVLPATITTIMDGAFSGCSKLASFLPQGQVTYYGASAFEKCASLTYVPMGETLLFIGDRAFASTAMDYVVIPHSVESMGIGAFADCQQLAAIELPFLGDGADDGATHFTYIFGAGMADNVENITLVPQSLKSVVVSEPLDILPMYAFFGCTSVENFVFSNTITMIGEAAFGYCMSLTSFDLTDVVVIGANAFRASGLQSATLPEVIVEVPDGVFADCAGLETVSLASQTTEIGEEAFLNCSILTAIEFPTSVTEIKKSAFEGCLSLSAVSLPIYLQSVPASAFKNCISLVSVELPETLETIGGSAFEECLLLSDVELPASLERIEVAAFKNCGALVNVTLPANLKVLEPEAFANSALTEITVPSAVTSIGYGAFAECNALEKITLPFVGDSAFGSEYKDIGHVFGGINEEALPASLKKVFVQGRSGVTIYNGAFRGCQNVEEIVFGDGVSIICDDAASECPRLLFVSLSESVTRVDEGAFAACYRLFEVEDLTQNYENRFEYALEYRDTVQARSVRVAAEKCRFAQYSDEWYLIDYDAQATTLSLPKNVRYEDTNKEWHIPAYMFRYNSVIKSISFPSTVKGIGVEAFTSSAIEKIVFDRTAPVEIIYEKTFAENYQLKELVLPNAVEYVEDYAFYNCTALAQIKLPGSLKTIGEKAFYECAQIPALNLPASVTTIGAYAFYHCGALETVALSEQLNSLGEHAFEECYKLKSVTFGSYLTQIPENTFYACSKLEQVTLPAALQSIGMNAFAYCDELKKISFPDDLVSIADLAFAHCSSLEQATVGPNLENIGDSAFLRCVELKRLLLPDSLLHIGAFAFESCVALERVTFGDKLETVGRYAFNECFALTSISLPDSVTALGEGAFKNCDALASVTLSAKLDRIQAYTFTDCDALGAIVIPNKVTNIDDFAFWHCDQLMNVALSSELERIGADAFYQCPQLYDVYYQGDLDITAGEHGFGDVGYYAVVIHSDMNEAASVEVVVDGDLVFRNAGDFWLLMQYTGNRTELSLKDLSCAGKKISHIGIKEYAFLGNAALQKLVLGAEVERMQQEIFRDCTSLTEVAVQGTALKKLPYATFYGCVNLRTVTLADSITTIGERAFEECRRLQSIVMPKDLETIESYAFYGCKRLFSVTLGENVQEIGNAAFLGCEQLYEVIDLTDSKISGSWNNGNVTDNAKVTFYTESEACERVVESGLTFINIYNSWYLHACEAGLSAESLKIPAKVAEGRVVIMKRAFEGTSIQNLFLPTKQGGEVCDWALSDISGLQNIYLSDVNTPWSGIYGVSANVWYYDTCIHKANQQKWTYDAQGNVQTDLCALAKKVILEPTCVEDGIEVMACDCVNACMYQENITAIPKLGHDYDEDGKCKNCDDVLPRTELSASSFEKWITDGFAVTEGFSFSDNKLLASNTEVGSVATLTFKATDDIRLIFTYKHNEKDQLQITVNGVVDESAYGSFNMLLKADDIVEIRYEKVEEYVQGEDLAWIQDLYFISY